MTYISKLRIVSILIFVFPLASINICLVLSQIFEFRNLPEPGNYFGDLKIFDAGDALRDKQDKVWAIPYFDGSASISRIGRVFPNYFIFKPFLILTGLLIIYYWSILKKIMKNNSFDKILLVGYLTGLCLILHSIFLGIKIDNNVYKIFVRLNLFFTLVFALTSKIYFISGIKKISENLEKNLNKKIIKLKSMIVYLLVGIAVIILPLLPFVDFKEIKYIIEWNYYVLIFTFYLLTFFMFKKTIL